MKYYFISYAIRSYIDPVEFKSTLTKISLTSRIRDIKEYHRKNDEFITILNYKEISKEEYEELLELL